MRVGGNDNSVSKTRWFKTTLLSALLIGVAGNTALADETKAKQNADVAKSIENILQKASEQGFVDLKETNQDPEPVKQPEPHTPEIIIEQLSASPQDGISCAVADLVELTDYFDVAAYSDISTAKAKMRSIDSLDDRIALIKTYWSLGLGAEALALVHSVEDQRVPLLKSVSKVLSGDFSENNKFILKQYAACNGSAKIWYKTALSDSNSKTPDEAKVLPDSSDLAVLEEMPVEIRKILTRRLGVLAAETGDLQLAKKMLRSIEPDTKTGDLPASRDDHTMYLFALIDASQKGQKGIRILERLSKFDGPLRTRSIFQLSNKYSADGLSPYPGFSDDLNSVAQQYSGKDESRMASLETIKLYLKNGSATESIKLAKRELSIDDPERVAVVTLIADQILIGLNDKKNSKRIGALNAYLFDSGFFNPLKTHAELKHAALEAALALNLPELGGQIYLDEEIESLDQNSIKRLTLAKMKAARKSGDVEKVIVFASGYKDDIEFSGLLIESLVETGRSQDAIQIVKAMPHGPERFKKLADLEWQAGDFKSAHSNLQSLDYAMGGKLGNKKLQLSGLLTSVETTYSNMIVPNSSEDLGEFQSDISDDINIAKAYLTGG
ncbi:MAG: hypothetical protein EX271_00980 [Acidimicrobiales bacterium]|nr:MAG: hypothetical protein EX271_00980 [Acidimicrobiales bacterium]